MAFELFGLTIQPRKGTKKDGPSEESLVQKEGSFSFVPPTHDDDAIVVDTNTREDSSVVAGGIGVVPYMSEGAFNDKKQRVYKYRTMANHPEVDEAISYIIHDAITFEDGKSAIEIRLDNVDLSDSIKDKIREEFQYCLALLDFSNRGYDHFREWYIDGIRHFHMVPFEDQKKGIKELRYIDPVNIKKVREVQREKNEKGISVIKAVKEYYVYRNHQPRSGEYEAIRVHPDSVITVSSGLMTPDRKQSIGYLHKAIKPLNDLVSVENATVIYRMARAPERRAIYIDIGGMPKHKGEQQVKQMMRQYRKKMVYDANTGEVDNKNRYMSMLEDFWLPRRGDKGTQIETLPGGQNLGEIDDIMYFQRKLYRSLNVPITRLDSERSAMPIGRAAEITRDELKFSKFIDRLRKKFAGIFVQFLRVQLVLKGVMTEEEWDEIEDQISFDFLQDFLLAEQKEADILESRLRLLRDANEQLGEYFSKEWIQRNVLRQTEDEIKEMEKQIEQEKKEGKIPEESEDDGFGF